MENRSGGFAGWCFSSLAICMVAATGCGSKSSSTGVSGSFPTITPPIKAATPAGLKGSSLMASLTGSGVQTGNLERLLTASLDLSQFKTDFFGTGPTVLFNITAAVDDRINGFNSGSTTSGCLSATPVAYTITPAGQANPITMYAQCYMSTGSSFTGDPGIVMIGKKNDVTYIWSAVGAGWVGAMATPDGSSYDIHAWYSVGIGNGASGSTGSCSSQWDQCSYGVAEVYTNASSGVFEMASAGLGMGYAGIQLASDGTNTYAIGDSGNGTNATLCVKSSDESTSASGGVCSASTPFSVTTAIGVKAGTGPATTVSPSGVSWNVSAYPTSGPNVTLDGTTSDSVHFGPTAVPSGVAKF
jgi:hypothetical protein